ncbi:transglycosylase SLT domain-containing protein [Streptomyces sp. DSM 3412]|uniref:Transglycosylase SLT domain-containing protein n=1 Tax=Streptomyces gottesmaniae TaxID=3075518 RepID=A0ABU2Z491_9ACTN|nr:transglycosylase SLT domain-containing protein [Streptomyces sp. DSM 3412]MDT0571261.1 transglycosylase SLT domain-containing protein [Streptomyces sp. DSM 3412]
MPATTTSPKKRIPVTLSALRRIASPKKALAGATLAVAATGALLAAAPAQAASEASQAQAVAKKMIGDSAQYKCFSQIVDHESDWDVNATNASSGAYGLVQALPGSKMASAGSDWQTNAATQIKWGVDYMKDRYGSPCGAWNFWQANNWY